MKKRGERHSRTRKQEQGSILMVGLFFLAFLLLLAFPLLFQLSNENKSAGRSHKATAAISLAEAGAERAIWELNHGDITSWSGGGSVWTMNISSFPTNDGQVIGDIGIQVDLLDEDFPVVESAGNVLYLSSLTVDRETRVVLERHDVSISLFDYGVFGEDGLELASNARIDSYDSSGEPYDPANPSMNGNVGTNATHLGCVYLNANASILGGVATGPESVPENIIITEPVSIISGAKQPLSSPKEMPLIIPPEGLTFMGDYILDNGGSDTISESGEYTNFRLSNSSTVTITSEVILYITGEFSMVSNTQLEIAEDANLTVYLGGSFVQESNTQINNLSMNPTSLLLLCTDSFTGDMEWNSNSDFWGAVYSPKANVVFNSSANFYGSVIGKYVDITSQANIHYDEALASLEIVPGSMGSFYTVLSWQEKIQPGE
ncbi:MAG: hypothetical protein GTO17_08235 [Candidatus Aminicenantes bacterium]|nr:hypothetical protein [Candidatus Aminicenantes bacterium]